MYVTIDLLSSFIGCNCLNIKMEIFVCSSDIVVLCTSGFVTSQVYTKETYKITTAYRLNTDSQFRLESPSISQYALQLLVSDRMSPKLTGMSLTIKVAFPAKYRVSHEKTSVIVLQVHHMHARGPEFMSYLRYACYL